MKYKLLKDLPDAKAGTILKSNAVYNEENMKNHPDWFAPYLFTTKDGVDIYAGDTFYTISASNYVSTWKATFTNSSLFLNNDRELFASNKKAEEYLESLIYNFKVGDIIVDSYNKLNKVTLVEKDYVIVDCELRKQRYKTDIRLATNDEIIQYYKKQGWVKGTKFRDKNNNIMVFSCFYIDENNKLCLFTDLNHTRYVKDCELIKEPDYPKSWEELKTLGDNYFINDNSYIQFIGEQYKDKIKTINKNVFNTEKQAKSALAFTQLTQLHKAMIDEYNRVNNCNWEADWSIDMSQIKYTINRYSDKLNIERIFGYFTPLAFPAQELAKFSLEHHKELWKQYYQI